MDGTTYPRMNKVFLTGTAQEEPELRYTPSGVSVSSFRVQVGRLLRDRSGGSREVAAYLTVVAWQETAQRMARELRKGQAIYVEGYVSSRSFTTARGDKRTAIEIYAEQIQILGPFQAEEPDSQPSRKPTAKGRETGNRSEAGDQGSSEEPAAPSTSESDEKKDDSEETQSEEKTTSEDPVEETPAEGSSEGDEDSKDS